MLLPLLKHLTAEVDMSPQQQQTKVVDVDAPVPYREHESAASIELALVQLNGVSQDFLNRHAGTMTAELFTLEGINVLSQEEKRLARLTASVLSSLRQFNELRSNNAPSGVKEGLIGCVRLTNSNIASLVEYAEQIEQSPNTSVPNVSVLAAFARTVAEQAHSALLECHGKTTSLFYDGILPLDTIVESCGKVVEHLKSRNQSE